MDTDVKSRFQAIALRWTDDAYVSTPSSVPDVVYHYTDAAGLIGMLQSGRIWATDYRFLNDRSEIDHTRSRVKSLIDQKTGGKRRPLLSQFYSKIAELQSRGIKDDVFVFSLSEEGDDLSQWRGYAREGQGFTIGFSGHAICEAATRDESEYSFFRIDYDHCNQMIAIKRALSAIEAEFAAQAGRKDADLGALCDEAAKAFVWVVNSRSIANKHKSFSSEKEWRIMAAVPECDRKRDVMTRASGLRLINYVELRLPISTSEKLPIVSIGVGPGFRGVEDALALKSLCLRTGYRVKIEFADTPYRRV